MTENWTSDDGMVSWTPVKAKKVSVNTAGEILGVYAQFDGETGRKTSVQVVFQPGGQSGQRVFTYFTGAYVEKGDHVSPGTYIGYFIESED